MFLSRNAPTADLLDFRNLFPFDRLRREVERIDRMSDERRCRICGLVKPLTDAHIPSRKLYKSTKDMRLFSVDADHIRWRGKVKWRKTPAPGGVHHKSLCKDCHNAIEGLCTPAYNNFARGVARVEAGATIGGSAVVELNGHLGRVARQALMYLGATLPSGVCDSYPELRSFILDPQSAGLPRPFRLWLFMIKRPSPKAPWDASGYTTGLISRFNTNDHVGWLAADVVHYPLGWRLMLSDFKFDSATDVTEWFDIPLDQCRQDVRTTLHCHALPEAPADSGPASMRGPIDLR